MNIKLNFLIVLAIGLGSSLSNASPMEDEAKWKAFEIGFENYKESIPAYLTDSSSVRVDHIPRDFSATSPIHLGFLENGRAVKFNEYCQETVARRKASTMFDAAEPYGMKFRGSPLSSETLTKAAQKSLSNLGIDLDKLSIGNHFKIESQIVKVKLTAESLSMKTGLSEKWIADYFQKQILAQSGSEYSLNLTGLDPFVCDLVTGRAFVAIEYIGAIWNAKHNRVPVISADEFGTLYQAVRSQNPDGNVFEKHIFNAARLAVALEKSGPKELLSFGAVNFVSLYKQIFEIASGVTINLDRSMWSTAAGKLDRFESTPRRIQFTVLQNPTTTLIKEQ